MSNSECRLCPYCGHELFIPDLYEVGELECDFCGNVFTVDETLDYFEESDYNFREDLAMEDYYNRKYHL